MINPSQMGQMLAQNDASASAPSPQSSPSGGDPSALMGLDPRILQIVVLLTSILQDGSNTPKAPTPSPLTADDSMNQPASGPSPNPFAGLSK